MVRLLACPGCGSTFRVRRAEPDRWLRCAGCLGPIHGDARAPVRWLYPERRLPADRPPGASDSTGATLDPAPSEEVVAGPPTVGRYQLRAELGRGGMGVVYAAWDPELERDVALKVLLAGSFASPQARARFIDEARVAAALHHDHIVRVFDLGEVEGRPWFAMERVFGPSLEEVIGPGRPLPPEEAARIGAGVAAGVAHAHAARVAHRDLKPANVLLDGDGHPHVSDFGLARRMGEERDLTRTDQVLGTPSWLAPEVARAEPDIDWVRADVYGIGAILFAAVSGRPPVDGATLHQRLEAAAQGARRSLRSLRPDVPAALDAIVSKAMCPEVGGRYTSAAELGLDLRRFLAGEAVSARPEPAAERGRRWVRLHRASLGRAMAVALAVSGAAALAPVASWWEARQRGVSARAAWAHIQPQQGTPEGAALLDDFLKAPEYRGTGAVAEAWLLQGDREAARPYQRDEWAGAVPLPVDAWARALTEAPDAPSRAGALLRLANLAWARGSLAPPDLGLDGLHDLAQHRPGRGTGYRDLATFVRALEALPSEAVPEAELLPLQILAGLTGGDREAAARAWDRARALGLAAATSITDPRWVPALLEQGERLGPPGPLRGGTLWELTAAHDPADPALIVRSGEVVSLQALRPTVHPAGAARLPGPHPRMIQWLPTGPVERPFPGTEAAWGDVDGDGVAEAYQTFERVVYRLSADGRSRLPVLPEVVRTNAEAVVDVADLDGDGRDELIVGLAEWRGYDVRVYTGEGSGHRLRARGRRNGTRSLTTIPDPWQRGRLVVTLDDSLYANAARHGVTDPGGPPAALVVWRLEGETLRELWSWQMPGLPGVVSHPRAADLDGDGRTEIVCSLEGPRDHIMAVIRAGEAPGSFGLSLFPGWSVVGARQLDLDPAIELLANRMPALGHEPVAPGEEELWILGRGDERPPLPEPPPRPPGWEPPAGALDGPRAQMWRDATLLVEASIIEGAAALLERGATLGGDAEAGVAASALWRRSGHLGDAASSMEQAAAASPAALAAGRWEEAVQLRLQMGDPAGALDAAAAWTSADGVGPAGPLAETLSAWAAAKQAAWRLDVGGALPSPWQVEEPLAFEAEEGATLVTYFSGPPVVLARLPLRAAGGPVAMLVDAVVQSTEWRAMGLIELVAPGMPNMGLRAVLPGAEKVPLLSLAMTDKSSMSDTLMLPRLGGEADRPIRVRLRLSWTPADATWRGTIEAPDLGRADSGFLAQPLPPELALELRTGGGLGSRLRLRVERLELWGLRPVVSPLDARHEAALDLLRRDPAAALARLPPEAALDRAVTLALLRRPIEAVDAFRLALEGDPELLGPRLSYLMRASDGALRPLLHAAAGPRWPGLFVQVYRNPVVANPRIPEVEEALRSELEDLPPPNGADDPTWELLAFRAGALNRGPDPGRGRQAMRELLEAIAAVPLSPDDDLAYVLAGLHREAALAAAARGDLDTARAEACRAIEASPTPVVAPDRIVASAEWSAAGLPPPGPCGPPRWAE